jgi:hypothetical protein
MFRPSGPFELDRSGTPGARAVARRAREFGSVHTLPILDREADAVREGCERFRRTTAVDGRLMGVHRLDPIFLLAILTLATGGLVEIAIAPTQ